MIYLISTKVSTAVWVKTEYYKKILLHSLHIKIMNVHNLHLKPGMMQDEDLVLRMKIKSNGHFN